MDSLSGIIREAATRFPNKVALIIDQNSYTYHELYELTLCLATSLSEQGISQGDCVAFLLPNSIEIILCYYACFMLGAIAVPINIYFDNEMIGYVLRQSKARIFITTSQFYEQLTHDGKKIAIRKPIYLIFDAHNYVDVNDFQKLLSPARLVNTSHVEIELTKPALIFFTSGTTGLPKAVVHSQHSLLQGTRNQIKHIQINHNDTTLVMFPVCFLIGLGSQILPFHTVGATVVLLPQFNPEEVLAKLQLHQISKIYGFPKLYLGLIDSAELTGHKVNTLNFCFSGGEAIPLALQERFKLFFNIEITEGCGMSELQIYCMNPPYGAKKVGSIGFPIVGIEMQLMDECNQLITQSNKTGEILVRGESMCSGYWQDNVLTASTIRKGWFHTGDLAYRDEGGCYWFVSRKVDILRCGEELISPLMIENLFYQHAAVKEVAAVALPNPKKANDDKIIVYIVLKTNNGKISSQELMNFVTISPLIKKHLQQIIIVKQLPYGFTGKIDRRELRNKAKMQK